MSSSSNKRKGFTRGDLDSEQSDVNKRRKHDHSSDKYKKKKSKKKKLDKRAVFTHNHVTSAGVKAVHFNRPFAFQYIMAPMVKAGDLAYRMLCRRYGTQLCYSPMIYSEKFVQDEQYRLTAIQQLPKKDRPLIIQFCANDPAMFLHAAKLVEDVCDGVDLNLGCPQRIAHSGHFGAYLLGSDDRPLVLKMVRTVAASLTIPLTVKIRLMDTRAETLTLCRELEANGCAAIAIHARYRGSPNRRRDGPAFWEEVKAVKNILRIPIISNGNIRTLADVKRCLKETGADGVMSAEGLLDDPSLFAGREHKANHAGDNLGLALEYLGCVEKYPAPPFDTVRWHTKRLCRKELRKWALYDQIGAEVETVENLKEYVAKLIQYRKEDRPAVELPEQPKKKNSRERRKEAFRAAKIARRAKERAELEREAIAKA